jgi:hypothetical protein
MYRATFLQTLGFVSLLVLGFVAAMFGTLLMLSMCIKLGLLIGAPLFVIYMIFLISTILYFGQN